jgi:transcriptional regulator with XRE-family HTH domain
MSVETVCLITDKGRKYLGQVLKHFRTARRWSMDDLLVEINRVTGFTVSRATISELERGNNEPKWNTLAILAATGYMIHPATGKPLSTTDLFAIACETLDPSEIIQTPPQ